MPGAQLHTCSRQPPPPLGGVGSQNVLLGGPWEHSGRQRALAPFLLRVRVRLLIPHSSLGNPAETGARGLGTGNDGSGPRGQTSKHGQPTTRCLPPPKPSFSAEPSCTVGTLGLFAHGKEFLNHPQQTGRQRRPEGSGAPLCEPYRTRPRSPGPESVRGPTPRKTLCDVLPERRPCP